MKPVMATPDQVAYLCEDGDLEARQLMIGGPEEAPDVIPCPTTVTWPAGREPELGEVQFHVAFELDEIELAALAWGGTLWLTTWGHLPIHLVHVSAPVVRS